MADSARLSLILCLAIGSYGCRACSCGYDYASPVANSPYAGQPGRAGSALSGALMNARLEQEATPTPPVEDMSDLEPPGGDATDLPVVEYAVAAEAEAIEAPPAEEIAVGVNLLR